MLRHESTITSGGDVDLEGRIRRGEQNVEELDKLRSEFESIWRVEGSKIVRAEPGISTYDVNLDISRGKSRYSYAAHGKHVAESGNSRDRGDKELRNAKKNSVKSSEVCL